MAWYINNQRIYVEKDTGWLPQPRIGEIDVLDSSQTQIHTAGRGSHRRTIVFVVFSGYDANILPLANPLVYPSGVLLASDQLPLPSGEGYVLVKSMKADRLYDRSRSTAVYRITTELIQRGSDGS